MLEFPQWLTVPLAGWTEAVMDWVQATFGGFFEVIGDIVLSGIYGAMSLALDIKFFYWRIPAAGWAFVILALAVLLVAAAAFITWRKTHKIKLVLSVQHPVRAAGH